MTQISYLGCDGLPLFAKVIVGSDADGVGPLVLMHGGGPDHRSLLPLAESLVTKGSVILPDVRGYGRSICRDPSRHTWRQYADDVISLLDWLGSERAIIGGAGLGGTIAMRTAIAHPERVGAVILVSVEDIEDDEAKAAEMRFMDAFAERVRTGGIDAGWAPILGDLAPVIGEMVQEAIPRADAASVIAAAAIGRDRSFRDINELAAISAPTLVFSGMDDRHPRSVAEEVARIVPRGELAEAALSSDIQNAEDFARAFAPAINKFIKNLDVQ